MGNTRAQVLFVEEKKKRSQEVKGFKYVGFRTNYVKIKIKKQGYLFVAPGVPCVSLSYIKQVTGAENTAQVIHPNGFSNVNHTKHHMASTSSLGEPPMRACAMRCKVCRQAQPEHVHPHRNRSCKAHAESVYSRKAARPKKPAAPAPVSLLAAPLKVSAVVVGLGGMTVPGAVPTGAGVPTAGGVVTPACDGAGVGVMVVVYGTAVLLGKGPSDTVTVWLGVAV